MKEMKTWFKLPVYCMPSDVGDWMEHVNFGIKGLSSHHCEAIEDAINNHDRLTSENARLREALLDMVNQFDAEGCVDFNNEADYLAIKNANQILAELEKGDE